MPEAETWRDPLTHSMATDGVRLLETQIKGSTAQFLLSTRPAVSPIAVVRSVKGRLQHLVRDSIPQLWRRHYSITSVGAANNEVLQSYVAGQVEHHPQVDPRVMERLSRWQFEDPKVDLTSPRPGSHGRFIHNLHVVLENADHLNDIREESLQTTQTMAIAVCARKGWLLSRLGIVGNHLHILVGCGANEIPSQVVLSLMNNLAYAHGMKRIYEFSYYLGTFGPYDQQAIRNSIAAVGR